MTGWTHAWLMALCAIAACAAGQAQTPPARVAHVVVALADNRYQGIVPVPPAIGNGDDPARNLYWGAGYGLKTFLKRSADWESIGRCAPGRGAVLERCVFRYRHANAHVIADAYRGREIKRAIADFFTFAAGHAPERVTLPEHGFVNAAGAADLVVYVGHDGLMDFGLDRCQYGAGDKRRDAVILSCASRYYFADQLRWTGATPLLWTTGLMAPEAYAVEAALAGWARKESGERIRERAALAYDKYQHCGAKAALRLFATGW